MFSSQFNVEIVSKPSSKLATNLASPNSNLPVRIEHTRGENIRVMLASEASRARRDIIMDCGHCCCQRQSSRWPTRSKLARSAGQTDAHFSPPR